MFVAKGSEVRVAEKSAVSDGSPVPPPPAKRYVGVPTRIERYIPPSKRPRVFENIPDDTLQHVVRYLTTTDALRFGLASKRMNGVVKKSSVALCLHDMIFMKSTLAGGRSWQTVIDGALRSFGGFYEVKLYRCNIPATLLLFLLETAKPSVVNIQECRNVRGPVLERICQSHCLTELFLAKVGSLTHQGGEALAEQPLRSLGIMNLTGRELPSIRHFAGLEYFAIPNSKLGDPKANASLIGTPDFEYYLSNLPNLKYLFLGGCQIDMLAHEFAATLALAPSLQGVELTFVRVRKDPSQWVAQEGVRGRWEMLSEHEDIYMQLKSRYQLLDFTRLNSARKAAQLADGSLEMRNMLRFAANCQDQWGRTPLNLNCAQWGNIKMGCTQAEQMKGSAETMQRMSGTNLMEQAYGRAPCTEIIVPDCESCGKDDCAHCSGQATVELTRLLLSLNADVTVPDHRGASALYRASERDAVGCVQLLLEAGAPFVIGHVQRRERPLFIAALRGCFRTVQALLDFVEPEDFERLVVAEGLYYNGYTPIHAAVVGGHLEVLELLLKYDTRIQASQQNRYGQTPLIISAHQNRIEAARMLIPHMDKQDLEKSDEYNITALGVAISQHCDEEFVNLLDHAGVPRGRIPKRNYNRRRGKRRR